ncbi:MAG TPA: gliding motility-associated C-terminal domain-containing protein, partial [Tenuifilaceae bacterium]|nr:gliding motility-associated C-terminal domain-containing protein [Tenuifilaceae bacterium]
DINGGAIAADQTVCNGADPVAFTSGSIATGGNGAFTYFWQQNTGSGWTNITGASGLTYDVPVGITQTTQYRRGATNLCGTGYSNTITVTVSNAINGGQISSPAAVCFNGDPVAFTDITSPSGGSGAWVYSWEYRVGVGAWNVIVGANALTYDIPAGQTETRIYRRVATNDCGTGYSNEVTVTVYGNTFAGTISGDQTLCYDGDPSVINSSILPTGGDASWAYLWEYQSNCAGGWIGIAGATSSTYDPPANQTETRCYRRVEINTCGTLYSNIVTITVTPEVTGNTISADQIICSGSSPAQLSGPIPTGGSGVYAYQWQSSTTAATGPFTDISGANNQNYSPAALTQTTYFRRVVTSGVCSSQSNVVTVTVNPSIANNTISAAQTICYNTTPSQLAGSTPTGGSGAYTYQWQSSTVGAGGPFGDILGATNVNYQPGNLTQNTWFRRIVNSIPCTNDISNVIAITVSPEFLVTGITTVAPTCNGYTNGSATVNITGGIAPYTYSWSTSPVQTGQTATGLSAGVNYTVTVTDASLCVAVGNVTLTEPAPISLGSITANPVTGCYGDNNGSIQILGAGGTPEYTYTLYDSGNNLIATQNPTLPAGANFTGLLGGTYRISIADANSCPSFVQLNIVVAQPAQITITDVQTTPISCAGSADGTITVLASGGTGALEYSIDNGVTFQLSNVFNVGEGYYDIVVRDASGCTTTWPTVVELTEPAEISFEYSVKNVTTCNGDNTGRISIYNVSGGSGTGYEYSIYQPETWGTDPVFDNLAGGPTNLYYVKVRDSHGCIQVANNGDPITLTQPAAINFTVNTVNVTDCWYNNNGRITVSGISGGTGSKTVSIDGVTYFPTTKIFNVGIGTYTVYVKDERDCIATKPAVITGPPAIVVDALTVTDATCFGSPDGSVNASASGGTGVLEYSLDGITYQATGLFNSVVGGTYTLYIRDANGCILEEVVTVGQPAALYFTTQTATDITCFGLTDGQITLVAAGGTAPYSYSITGGAPYGNATGVFTGLSAGGYTAAVMDANGCNIVGNPLTISEPPIIQITGTISTDITCFGQSDGTITITAIGGIEPRVYRLLDAGSNEVANNTDGLFTGVDAGTYTVEVTDANSCGPITSVPITIVEPLDIVISTVPTHVAGCNGDDDGALTINVSGGTAPYTYSIDGGVTFQPSNIFTNLTAGTYSIVVMDLNGCSKIASETINQPDPITIDEFIVTQETIFGASDGQIEITAIGGTGSFTYDLYLEGVLHATQSLAAPAGAVFTNLGAGTYYVIVTDGNGCFVQTADVLISGTSVVVAPTMVSCNGNNDGRILLTITGGFPPFTIGCTNSASQPFTFTDLGGGQYELTGLSPETYTITIADTKTTYPDEVVTITEPAVLTASFVSLTNPTCNGLSDGSVEFNITGGTTPYSVIVSDGVNPPVEYTATNVSGDLYAISNVPAGLYTFTVKDANDCQVQVTDVPELIEPTAITVTDFVKVDVTCNGQANGSITVTATGGTGLLTYSITGPVNLSNNDGIFADLPAGTYNLSITDVNSCPVTIAVNPISITEPSAINITWTKSLPLDCANSPDGFINIDVTGGQLDYTFLWSNGSTTKDLTGVVKGVYSVVVTDALNCSVSSGDIEIDGVDMLELDPPLIDSTDCYIIHKTGTKSGGIQILDTFTGGNATTIDDLSFSWVYPDGVTTATGRTLTDLAYGTYRVMVTDTKGCVYTNEYTVPVKSRYDYTAFAGNDTTVCFDNPVTLHGSAIGGAADLTYTYGWWIHPDISSDPISTDKDFVVQTTGTNIYRLRVVDSDEACENYTDIILSVLPEIGLQVPMYVSSVQDTVISVLYGQEFNMDVITTSVEYATSFQWKPAEMFLPSTSWDSKLLLNDEIMAQIPADRFVKIKDSKTGKTTDYILVDVLAKTEVGCTDSIRLYAKIVDEVSFGNIFSPNGDGKNDVWRVPKNYLFPDLEIEIFNRWGSLVWSAKGEKAAKGWDGRTNSGNELPIGTYYYVIKFNVKAQGSNWKPLTGSVTIVK